MEEFHPTHGPDQLKLFGFQLWGTSDTKKPADAYDIGDIRRNLKIDFIPECYNATDFFMMVVGKIAQVNTQMREERVRLNITGNIQHSLSPDVVFKYGITLYGQQWTVYKGYGHFKKLHGDVRLS